MRWLSSVKNICSLQRAKCKMQMHLRTSLGKCLTMTSQQKEIQIYKKYIVARGLALFARYALYKSQAVRVTTVGLHNSFSRSGWGRTHMTNWLTGWLSDWLTEYIVMMIMMMLCHCLTPWLNCHLTSFILTQNWQETPFLSGRLFNFAHPSTKNNKKLKKKII